MKKLSFIFALLFISTLAFAQDITQGTWFNEQKTSKIQFYKQGNKLFGKIVWLKEPLENGKPRVDKFNSDAKLKIRPLMGLVFLTNFTADGEKVWEDGEIYDPNNGKTYSCTIKIKKSNELEIRGFIGISLLGRTTIWTRSSQSPKDGN